MIRKFHNSVLRCSGFRSRSVWLVPSTTVTMRVY